MRGLSLTHNKKPPLSSLCLNVKVVEVLIYLAGHLGCHHKHPVRGEHQDPVVCLVPALLELHAGLEQDLGVFTQRLANPLRGILVG